MSVENKLAAVTLFVLFVPLVAGLVSGLIQRLSSRLCGRAKTPILQSFYDLLKLFEKDGLGGGKLAQAKKPLLRLKYSLLLMAAAGAAAVAGERFAWCAAACCAALLMVPSGSHPATGSSGWLRMAALPILFADAGARILIYGNDRISEALISEHSFIQLFPAGLAGAFFLLMLFAVRPDRGTFDGVEANEALAFRILINWYGLAFSLCVIFFYLWNRSAELAWLAAGGCVLVFLAAEVLSAELFRPGRELLVKRLLLALTVALAFNLLVLSFGEV